MEITKDTVIGQLIREKPEAVQILMDFGMACIGCPSSQTETIGEAAVVHGLDVDELLTSLNHA